MRTRKTPLTAKQYIDLCQAKRNRAACRRLDIRDAIVRGLWVTAAIVGLCIVTGNLIQALLLFAAN